MPSESRKSALIESVIDEMNVSLKRGAPLFEASDYGAMRAQAVAGLRSLGPRKGTAAFFRKEVKALIDAKKHLIKVNEQFLNADAAEAKALAAISRPAIPGMRGPNAGEAEARRQELLSARDKRMDQVKSDKDDLKVLEALLKDADAIAAEANGVTEGARVMTPFAPLKGRSTDVRQQLPGLVDFDSPYKTLSNQRWLVAFPEDQYPADVTYLGPVAMALVGHYDMDPTQFQEFLFDVHHTAYPRQNSEPTIAVASTNKVDVRRLIRGGDYEPALRFLSPAAVRVLAGVVKMVDDVQGHPLSHQGLSALKSLGPLTVTELANKLRELAGGLIEPGYNQGTMGDVMNNISYPFGTGGIN